MANAVYKTQAASGDLVQVDHDGAASAAAEGWYIQGLKVLGKQEAAIADITPAADGTTAGTAVNAILAVLRAHGLIAT